MTVEKATRANTILGLLAQTSIHAGTGQNTGVIDLPIQREGHNGWPCVFGSAVKGAMRARAEEMCSTSSVTKIFGPDTKNAGEYASAIMISDARIVLFPVRSLTTQFKWVTCPAVLKRLQNDMKRFGFTIKNQDKYEYKEKDDNKKSIEVHINEKDNKALVPKLKKENKALFLEEYRFIAEEVELGHTIRLLSQLMGGDSNAKKTLQEQLVIVNDDNFTHLVQHVTPVNAHIVIKSQKKTTENLWYEETLPPETLLYVGLSAIDARQEKANCPAENVLNAVMDLFNERPWLQIGGNETVGMGWCAIHDYREHQEG